MRARPETVQDARRLIARRGVDAHSDAAVRSDWDNGGGDTRSGFQASSTSPKQWAQRAQAQPTPSRYARLGECPDLRRYSGVQHYLLDIRPGRPYGQARQRVSSGNRAAWSAAQAAGTREALEQFLMRYADAPQAEQARSQLAALAPPPPPPPEPKTKPKTPPKAVAKAPVTPPGDYQVQLGAFSSLDKAKIEQAAWRSAIKPVARCVQSHRIGQSIRVKTVGSQPAPLGLPETERHRTGLLVARL